MLRILLISALVAFGTMSSSAQANDQPTKDQMENEMGKALEDLSGILDTLDMESLFGADGIEGLLKGFSMDGKEMQDLNGTLDSLGISNLLGGDISEMFEGLFGKDGMDMGQIDKMMEESLGMMKDMDMSQFQKMFESLDLSEMMKMFEGMDMEGFDGILPPQLPQDETPTDSKGKKLKKI